MVYLASEPRPSSSQFTRSLFTRTRRVQILLYVGDPREKRGRSGLKRHVRRLWGDVHTPFTYYRVYKKRGVHVTPEFPSSLAGQTLTRGTRVMTPLPPPPPPPPPPQGSTPPLLCCVTTITLPLLSDLRQLYVLLPLSRFFGANLVHQSSSCHHP